MGEAFSGRESLLYVYFFRRRKLEMGYTVTDLPLRHPA